VIHDLYLKLLDSLFILCRQTQRRSVYISSHNIFSFSEAILNTPYV